MSEDVRDDWTPHPSHKMTPWRETILAMASADRFGRIRKCEHCEAEEAIAGGAGSHVRHEELDSPCPWAVTETFGASGDGEIRPL